MAFAIPISIQPQPDETTCGPTCLHSIYNFYGDLLSLSNIINEVQQLEGGGTLGAILGAHALKRNYDVTIYTYNLRIFDPSWFGHEAFFIKNKLLQQAEAKSDAKFQIVTQAYTNFLDLGGTLRCDVLRTSLIRKYLRQGIPLLVGLSATYLYNSKREFGPNAIYDDIRGEPSGHFVILHGYNKKDRTVMVADPLQSHPFGVGLNYKIEIHKVINAILLGVLTYDANLIIITPQDSL